MKPYKCEFAEEKEHFMKKYDGILNKVKELLDYWFIKETVQQESGNKGRVWNQQRKRILQFLEIAKVSREES